MIEVFDKIRDLDEFIQISLLSEFYYCKRRCSLILLEGNNSDNVYTMEGTIQHSKVHSSQTEKRLDSAKIFNLELFSNNYSLIGKADCIECVKDKRGAYIDILDGYYNLYPVEYKHGKLRDEEEYKIQLCAQAICLEEMYNITIEKGYLYFINDNKRLEVRLSDELRQKVLFGIVEIFKIISESKMYPPKYKKSCPKCSLYEKCAPKNENINGYIKNMWEEIL